MTVAFIPAFVLVGLIYALANRDIHSMLRVGLGLAVGAAVAATWYVHNFSNVYQYLTGFGFGAQAANYGPSRSPLSLHDWYIFFITNTDAYFYAGEAAVFFLGWIAFAAFASRGGLREAILSGNAQNFVCKLLEWLKTGPLIFTGFVVSAEGLTALITSRNQGSAFIAPLVLPISIVAAWGIDRGADLLGSASTAPRHSSRRGSVLVTLLITVFVGALVVPDALLTFLPMATETSSSVAFPDSTRLTLWDSIGTLRLYEDAGEVAGSVEANPGTKSAGRSWLEATAYLNNELRTESQLLKRPPLLVFTFRDRLINVNTIEMDGLLRFGATPGVTWISPVPGDDSPRSLISQVSGLDSQVTMVATATPGPDEFQPELPAGIGSLYVDQLNFVKLAHYRLPDGRQMTLWVPHP
jgi:hypothetical protein